jgi:hypothetical protein
MELDQVVTIGYGTADRRNLTGAVEQVNGEELATRPVPNLTQALQGVLKNVNIRPMDGKPIQSPVINIRGMTSIGTGGSALVLVDGVEGDPALINPDDVESISVLKDASSAAVTVRAARSGVAHQHETPEGEQFRINYGATYGLKQPTAMPDFVTDGYTLREMFNEATRVPGVRPQQFNKTMVFNQAFLDSLAARSKAGTAPGRSLSGRELRLLQQHRLMKLLYNDHVPRSISTSVCGTDNASSWSRDASSGRTACSVQLRQLRPEESARQRRNADDGLAERAREFRLLEPQVSQSAERRRRRRRLA